MDFDMEKFSYRLIVLMEDFNMSQVDLSNKIGISNVTISRYLSGDRIPRLDVITKIASAFNVSVDYLLGLSDDRNGEDANTNTDVDIALLAKNLFGLDGNSHLSKKQKELIKNLLMANKKFILSAWGKLFCDNLFICLKKLNLY